MIDYDNKFAHNSNQNRIQKYPHDSPCGWENQANRIQKYPHDSPCGWENPPGRPRIRGNHWENCNDSKNWNPSSKQTWKTSMTKQTECDLHITKYPHDSPCGWEDPPGWPGFLVPMPELLQHPSGIASEDLRLAKKEGSLHRDASGITSEVSLESLMIPPIQNRSSSYNK